MTFASFRGPLAALLLAAGASLARGQTPAADPAEWAPADAIVYVGATDLKALVDGFKQTAAYRMMTKEQGLGGPLARYKQMSDKIRERIGGLLETPAEQVELPHGAAAIYLALGAEGFEGDPLFGLVVNVAKNEANTARYDKLLKKLREKAKDYEAVEAGSHRIDVLRGGKKSAGEGGDDDAEEDEEVNPFGLQPDEFGKWADRKLDEFFSPEALPETLAMCLSDGRLIVSNDAEQVKAVLRRNNRADSLAGHDDYAEFGRQFKSAGPLRFMVNIPRIVEVVSRADDAEAHKAISVLGARELRSLIGHVVIGGEQFEQKSEAVLLTRGQPSGLVKALTLPNRALTPPDTVPASSAMCVWMNVDAGKLAEDIEHMIRQDDPAAADQMHQALESAPTPGGETINLRREIVDNLRPPLAAAMSFTKPYGVDSARLLVSVGHRSRELIGKLVVLFPPGMLAARDFRGTQVYDAPMGGMTLAGAADTLLLGNRAAVESGLQPGGDTLASSELFRKMAKLMPEEASLAVYVDSRALSEAAIGISEKREEIEPTAMMNFANMIAVQMAAAMTQEYQGMSPDEMRKLLRYQAPLMATCTTTPAGLRFTFAQLKVDP